MRYEQIIHAVRAYDAYLESFALALLDYYGRQPYNSGANEVHTIRTRFIHQDITALRDNLKEKAEKIATCYKERRGNVELLVDATEKLALWRAMLATNEIFKDSLGETPEEKKWNFIKEQLIQLYKQHVELLFLGKNEEINFVFAGKNYNLRGLLLNGYSQFGYSKLSALGQIINNRLLGLANINIETLKDTVQDKKATLECLQILITKTCSDYAEIEKMAAKQEENEVQVLILMQQLDELKKRLLASEEKIDSLQADNRALSLKLSTFKEKNLELEQIKERLGRLELGMTIRPFMPLFLAQNKAPVSSVKEDGDSLQSGEKRVMQEVRNMGLGRLTNFQK